VDPAWRLAFARQTAAPPGGSAEEVDLVSRIDTNPALSASLHLFRRPPEPAELTRIRIDRERARAIRLPAATTLGNSPRAAFPGDRCAPDERR
jgi:hypothetical protein